MDLFFESEESSTSISSSSSSDEEMEVLVAVVQGRLEREHRSKVKDFVGTTVAEYNDMEVNHIELKT